jgi:hypothetical protein
MQTFCHNLSLGHGHQDHTRPRPLADWDWCQTHHQKGHHHAHCLQVHQTFELTASPTRTEPGLALIPDAHQERYSLEVATFANTTRGIVRTSSADTQSALKLLAEDFPARKTWHDTRQSTTPVFCATGTVVIGFSAASTTWYDLPIYCIWWNTMLTVFHRETTLRGYTTKLLENHRRHRSELRLQCRRIVNRCASCVSVAFTIEPFRVPSHTSDNAITPSSWSTGLLRFKIPSLSTIQHSLYCIPAVAGWLHILHCIPGVHITFVEILYTHTLGDFVGASCG